MRGSKAFLDRSRREEQLNVNLTTRTIDRTSTIAAVVLAAVCITWVVVALIHPTSLIDEDRSMWVVVHIAQLIFAPIVALGILALLKGAEGLTAALARGAAVLWAAWFSAYDAVAGIGTGILIGGYAREAGEYLYAHDLITGLGWVPPGCGCLPQPGRQPGLRPATPTRRQSQSPSVKTVERTREESWRRRTSAIEVLHDWGDVRCRAIYPVRRRCHFAANRTRVEPASRRMTGSPLEGKLTLASGFVLSSLPIGAICSGLLADTFPSAAATVSGSVTRSDITSWNWVRPRRSWPDDGRSGAQLSLLGTSLVAGVGSGSGWGVGSGSGWGVGSGSGWGVGPGSGWGVGSASGIGAAVASRRIWVELSSPSPSVTVSVTT
jgi:hypothetical protein